MIRGEEAPVVLPPLDEPPATSAPPDNGAPAPISSAAPSPSASAAPASAGFAAIDVAAVAPQPAPAAPSDQEAANDPDLAMVTAQPRDRELAAATTRLAGL
jgi:hypothetical protein